MKKFHNFLAVCMIVCLAGLIGTAKAQNDPIFSEDFAALTGSGTQQCEASNSEITNTLSDYLPGWTGVKVYSAAGKVKLGTSSVAGAITTAPFDANGSIRIVFDARCWNGSDATTMTVTVGSNVYEVTGLPNTGSSSNVECDLATFEVIASASGSTTITFTGDKRIFLDNISVYPATSPAVAVNGTTTFTNVGVNEACNTTLVATGYNLTAGGTTTIAISGDSQFTTTATTAANDDLMTEDGVEIPVAFTAAEAGTYNATLTLTNSDLSEPVTVALSATVIDITEVATIAELRNLIDWSNVDTNFTDDTFYKYTGHAYVTQTFRSGSYNKWMQDATGAIQLYDPSFHLTNVSQGQEITNVVGKLANYYGYLELNVQAGINNSDINAFPTTVPEPLDITLSQLQDKSYMDGIQGQLVRVNCVTFSATGNFERQIRYVVSDGTTTDTAVYFTGQYDTYVGEEIPTSEVSVVGVTQITAAYSNGYGTPRVDSRYYILPREMGACAGVAENEQANVNVYPNPTANNVTLEIANPVTHVAIYNMLGELVDSQAVAAGSNVVRMSQLTHGVYFLRIFNGNELVGTAKVVRN